MKVWIWQLKMVHIVTGLILNNLSKPIKILNRIKKSYNTFHICYFYVVTFSTGLSGITLWLVLLNQINLLQWACRYGLCLCVSQTHLSFPFLGTAVSNPGTWKVIWVWKAQTHPKLVCHGWCRSKIGFLDGHLIKTHQTLGALPELHYTCTLTRFLLNYDFMQ